MRVAKRMEPAARNIELVQNRPQLPLHDFVGAHWPPDLICEKQPERVWLPRLQITLEHVGQGSGIGSAPWLALLLSV